MNSPASSGSLRVRLSAWLIGGAAVLGLILFFAVRSYATDVAQKGQDQILAAAAASILDAARLTDGTVDLDMPYAAFSMLNTSSDDRVFYAIRQDGTFLSGYADLPDQASRFETVAYNGANVRSVFAERRLIGVNGPSVVSITLAQTQDGLSETLSQISRNAALLGLGFFVLAAGLSYWVTSWTVGQLSRLTASVTRRGPADLSPFERPVPAEMLPLVGSLNSLMGRLDGSLQRSEDFIAEAAHRVRTPLATVRSYAEVTLQRVDKEENRSAMRSMIRAIDESSRAAGQLLDHAMIAFRADHLTRDPLDLVDLVKEQVMRLTPVADMKDIDLSLFGDDQVPYSGDPILIQNAVRNLIDNALKYSPAERTVTITVASKPTPNIEVCDQGPGIAESELQTVSGRFARGKNAIGTVGSGLGLTIVGDVAMAHGGQLTLSNRPQGGLCARLSL